MLMQESQRRFKRSDGASHPYHAKFGVAQSAKYDFFFSAAGRARTPPPFLLADTDVIRRSRRAEPTDHSSELTHPALVLLSRLTRAASCCVPRQTIYQCTAAEMRTRFRAFGTPLVIGAEFAWFVRGSPHVIPCCYSPRPPPQPSMRPCRPTTPLHLHGHHPYARTSPYGPPAHTRTAEARLRA